MSPAQRLSTTALVAVLAETGLSSAAAAHGDHRPPPLTQKEEGLQQGLKAGLQKGDRKLLPHLLPHLFPGVRTHGFTGAPAGHRCPSAEDRSCSPPPARHTGQCRPWLQSVDKVQGTMPKQVGNDASEAWRDHVLKQVVDYLETHRDEIIDRFEVENSYSLKREDIEQSDLLDFDVSVTLHRDQSSSLGLGFGFFKANMIRCFNLRASRSRRDPGVEGFVQPASGNRNSFVCLQIQQLCSSGADSSDADRCSCVVVI